MGIKHFFKWFRNNFSRNISHLKSTDKLNIEIDNLFLDLNGIYHHSAQRIYQYGSYKPLKSLMDVYMSSTTTKRTEVNPYDVYRDVCDSILTLFRTVNPKKRLILCVDGPAPQSKQSQQRQRRFRSARENNGSCPFDSNNITPGTEWMDKLSAYIKHTFYNLSMTTLKDIEIIFSSEKVPMEGEQKAFYYLRKYGVQSESNCIHSMDADIVMLSLASPIENVYILREDSNRREETFFVDVKNVRTDLYELMRFPNANVPDVINDFVFMCFMVGNDFLPNIPALEIIEGGIDEMMKIYREVGEKYGHLSRRKVGENTGKLRNVLFNKNSLSHFLRRIGEMEGKILQLKSQRERRGGLLEESRDSKGEVEVEKYKKLYYSKKLGITGEDTSHEEKKLCHSYLQGMQWVLSYYTVGVPCWDWIYPYHYGPFASDMARYVKSFIFPQYEKSEPKLPFVQLLCVLPPFSASLLPPPLAKLLTDPESPLREYCPTDFTIDIEGKREEWEGCVILPFIDVQKVKECYASVYDSVSEYEKQRNVVEKTLVLKNGKSVLIKM